jgi:hypothetical protein
MGEASAGRFGHLMGTFLLQPAIGGTRGSHRWAILAETGDPEVHIMIGPARSTMQKPLRPTSPSAGQVEADRS